MPKYNTLFKWELSSILTSFLLLADYLSVKLISEKIIKAEKDDKYLTSIQPLSKSSLDFFCSWRLNS